MAGFIPCDYSRNTMVVVNFLEQIQSRTLEHAMQTGSFL
jgi:hypothetical protein